MHHKLTALSLLLLASGTFAQESYSAKSLFFGEDDSVVSVSTTQKDKAAVPVASTLQTAKKPTTTIAKNKTDKLANLGASYFIRLRNADGSTRDVLASRKFNSGERFQLGVKVNRPSYLYIMNEGPDGKVAQIYPQSGHNNFVDAMGVVFLPAQGSFEFDSTPGTEQLLVYMSPTVIHNQVTEKIRTAMPDIVAAPFDTMASATCNTQSIDNAAAPQKTTDQIQVASTDVSQYASKGIAFAADAGTTCNQVATVSAYASKGIAFTDDPAPAAGGQVASYVVKTAAKADANLYLKIKLVHQ